MNRDENTLAPVNAITVLVDTFTKASVQTITYDVLSKHVAIITDIREIGDEHFRSNLVIFEPAISIIVTPEILRELQDTFELNVFIVYQEEALTIPFREMATCVKADYSDLNWNFVYAVVNLDQAILEPYQRSARILDGFKAVLQKVPEDMQDYFSRFRGTYLNLVAATSKLVEENAKLHTTIEAQEEIGRQTIAGLLELKQLFDKSQDKVNAYELLLSKEYDVTFGGFYPERPRVLYLKKISHVAGMDLFLSVLFAVLNKQYKSSCKIVKLLDSSNSLDLRYIPNTYTVVTDPYNTSEILTNDFLLKLGSLDVMFDTLMLNRSGLEYLIVHDMRGTMSPALSSNLIDLQIHEISADHATLGEYDNVFSSGGEHVVFPWDFKECVKYSGTGVVKLANHPTVGSVIELLL